MQAEAIRKIDKADIPHVRFGRNETLSLTEEISHRTHDLTRAMTLGNLFKDKVKIQFENHEGEPMETEATIWSVTDRRVLLKGGVTIPVHSISKVILV